MFTFYTERGKQHYWADQVIHSLKDWEIIQGMMMTLEMEKNVS